MYKKLDSGDVTLRLNALLIYSDREELDTFSKSIVTFISLMSFSLRQIPRTCGSGCRMILIILLWLKNSVISSRVVT